MVSKGFAGRVRAPLEQVEEHPWSFLILALGAGMAVGVLMRSGAARRALKYYLGWKQLV